MIFAIENSDMKNAIHLFEINIQFKKKKPQTRQKENKNGGKRNERKVRKKKKILFTHSYMYKASPFPNSTSRVECMHKIKYFMNQFPVSKYVCRIYMYNFLNHGLVFLCV